MRYLACVVLGYGIAKLPDLLWLWYATPHERAKRRLDAKRSKYARQQRSVC